VVKRGSGGVCFGCVVAAAGEVGVDLGGDPGGGLVVGWPQGADDVAVAGELERGGDVDGLVG
jgi:hypothetical protein